MRRGEAQCARRSSCNSFDNCLQHFKNRMAATVICQREHIPRHDRVASTTLSWPHSKLKWRQRQETPPPHSKIQWRRQRTASGSESSLRARSASHGMIESQAFVLKSSNIEEKETRQHLSSENDEERRLRHKGDLQPHLRRPKLR